MNWVLIVFNVLSVLVQAAKGNFWLGVANAFAAGLLLSIEMMRAP